MKTKHVIITLATLLILFTFYLMLPMGWSFYQSIFRPLGSVEINREYQLLSSEDLINKLRFSHPFGATSYCAMEALAQRGEIKAVPEIIKYLKSINPSNRYQAIRALGNIGDTRAVEPLLEIVNKGESKNNLNYTDALYSLCQIGSEPARSIVLQRLQRSDGIKNGSINMMKYVGRVEDIPLLENMKLTDHSQGKLTKSLTNEAIDNAISKIRARNK